MRRILPRPALLPAALLATGLLTTGLLAGCGGGTVVVDGESSLSAATAVREAAAATRAATSASFAGGDDGVAGPDAFPASTWQGRFRTGAAPALQMLTRTAAEGDYPASAAEQIIVGNAVYEREVRPDGDPEGGWSKSDLAEADSLADADPIAQLALLSTVRDVRRIGTETRDGVVTTHYSGTISADEYVAAYPEDEQAGTRRSMEDSELHNMAFESWVDAEGRLRRVELSADLGKNHTRAWFAFADFGKPVTIQAPRADEVDDIGPDLTAGDITVPDGPAGS